MNAPRELVSIIRSMYSFDSVLDVGCGTGTWLAAFAETGIKDYTGIDDPNMDVGALKIARGHFVPIDLAQTWSLNRAFGLVLALEVAEHIPANYADDFVKSLVAHGDLILFSAAIPGQGGQHHINEQWLDYWEAKFNRHDYYFHDDIRPLIWSNEKVDWWYRQNMVVVRKGVKPSTPARSLVHPELFTLVQRNQKEYYQSLTTGKQGLRLGWKIFIRSLLYKLGWRSDSE